MLLVLLQVSKDLQKYEVQVKAILNRLHKNYNEIDFGNLHKEIQESVSGGKNALYFSNLKLYKQE